MAITFEKTTYPGTMDAFWRQEVRMLPGGFKPKQTFPVGEVVQRGALVFVDYADMTAAIIKVGKIVDGGTTSKPRVTKRNNFCAGDTIMKIGATGAVTIKSVDRTNPDYDVLELSGAITGLAKDDFVQEAKQVDSGYAAAYTPNMILGNDFESKKSGLPTLDVAWSAMVLKDVCGAFPEEWLTTGSPCLATNHNILFIHQ